MTAVKLKSESEAVWMNLEGKQTKLPTTQPDIDTFLQLENQTKI